MAAITTTDVREACDVLAPVYEATDGVEGGTLPGTAYPVVVITSNNEKELPDAFLRRCFFHFIKFPEADTMRQIVNVHFPTLKADRGGCRCQT